VVIAIIGVLVALLLPAVQAAREAARRSQCVNNLKQVGLALHNHADAQKYFPPGHVAVDGRLFVGANEASWITYVLPYLEQQALHATGVFNSTTYNFGWPSPASTHPNYKICSTRLPTMICPSSTASEEIWFGHWVRGNYVGNNGLGPMTEVAATDTGDRQRDDKGVFFLNSRMTFSDLLDGSSNTMLVSEVITVPGEDQRGVMHYPEGPLFQYNDTPNSSVPDQLRSPQTHAGFNPQNCISKPHAPCSGAYAAAASRAMQVTARSLHPGGVNVLMGDGSVHFASDNIALAVWRAAGTPSAVANEIVFSGF